MPAIAVQQEVIAAPYAVRSRSYGYYCNTACVCFVLMPLAGLLIDQPFVQPQPYLGAFFFAVVAASPDPLGAFFCRYVAVASPAARRNICKSGVPTKRYFVLLHLWLARCS